MHLAIHVTLILKTQHIYLSHFSLSLSLSLSLPLPPTSACGIEYCVECERSEGEGGRDECRVCLADTILFDGRCYSCPDALIARTAILQEAEEREELAEQRARQIEC